MLISSMADSAQLQVYAIPGQNGLGSSVGYVRNLLGNEAVNVTSVPTPASLPDFGQSRCLGHLREVIRNISFPSIIHATSQGTATALNYVAHEDKGRQIKALILEATLGSGNSAIHHTASGPLMGLSTLANLPFAYYWMPYVAKVLFPAYSPSGQQPIRSLKNIPKNVVVVIAHSERDPQLSYDDACALYYGLREQGNPAYLVTKEGCNHIDVLNDNKDSAVVRAILGSHQLLPSFSHSIDLAVYQPKHEQYKEKYDMLLGKEKNHLYLGYTLTAGACAAACYFLKKMYSVVKGQLN